MFPMGVISWFIRRFSGCFRRGRLHMHWSCGKHLASRGFAFATEDGPNAAKRSGLRVCRRDAGSATGKLQNLEMTMSLGTILLIILILILLGALPTWPYSAGWGYYPSGGIGLVVIILLILVLMGRL